MATKKRAAAEAPKVPTLKLRPQREPWASRAKGFPSRAWANQWVAALKSIYPRQTNQEAVDLLWPGAVEQWRFGATPESAARNVCLVDGLLEPVAGSVRRVGALLVESVPRGSQIQAPGGLPSVKEGCDGPACDFGLAGAVCGLPAELVVPSASVGSNSLTARYCLTDVRNLITSHDPLTGFRVRSDYPANVQERDYSTPGERLKVEDIANNLIPGLILNPSAGALDNLPVANERGVILGGNGRTMGVLLYYRDGDPRGLKEYIRTRARQYGFTSAEVDRIAQPIIVRTIRTSDDQRELARLVRLLNVGLGFRLDAKQAAVSQARSLDPRAIEVLADNLDDEIGLSEYLSSSRSSAFIQRLRDSQIITDRNSAEYLTDKGLLNLDGRRVVDRLLLSALIPSTSDQEALGDGLAASLTRAAPFLLAAGAADPKYDLSKEILAASRDIQRIRSSRPVPPDVTAYLRQTTIGTEQPAITGLANGEPVLRVLYALATSPAKLTRFARLYLAYAKRPAEAATSLIPPEILTPRAAIIAAGQAVDVTFP